MDNNDLRTRPADATTYYHIIVDGKYVGEQHYGTGEVIKWTRNPDYALIYSRLGACNWADTFRKPGVTVEVEMLTKTGKRVRLSPAQIKATPGYTPKAAQPAADVEPAEPTPAVEIIAPASGQTPAEAIYDEMTARLGKARVDAALASVDAAADDRIRASSVPLSEIAEFALGVTVNIGIELTRVQAIELIDDLDFIARHDRMMVSDAWVTFVNRIGGLHKVRSHLDILVHRHQSRQPDINPINPAVVDAATVITPDGRYEVTHIYKRATRDSFNEGCSIKPDDSSECEINMRFSSRTLAGLLHQVSEQLGVSTAYVCVYDDDGPANRISINRQENDDGNEPSADEWERFKASEIDLWLADYDLMVRHVIERGITRDEFRAQCSNVNLDN